MAALYLRKLYDTFAPDDESSAEAMEKLKGNSVYKCLITAPRNYKFHKKLFSLFNLAYQQYEPESLTHEGVIVKKEFDNFRKGIVIQAGYFDAVYRLDGGVELKAKSLKFAEMSPETVEKVYSACVDVVIEKVLTNYTRDDIDTVMYQILGYA